MDELTPKVPSTTGNDQPLRPRFGIFVDANILLSVFRGRHSDGFDVLNTELEVLRLISGAASISLFTSEVTRIEAAKNLAENDCELIACVVDPKFRNTVNEMIGVHLPDANTKELYQEAYKRHLGAIETATSGKNWECLKFSNTHLEDIFLQYGQKQGLFADHTKKHQFADAVVFEQIKREATADSPVVIYSRDKDFVQVGREIENIEYAGSLPDLVKLFGMDHKVPEVNGLIEGHSNLIIDNISKRLDTFCFCESHAGKPEPRQFGNICSVEVKQGANIRFANDIIVSGRVTIEAQLSRQCLSTECPLDYVRGWKIIEPIQVEETRNNIDAVFEIEVTAVMHEDDSAGVGCDKGEKTLHGTLFSMTEGGDYGIMDAEWNVNKV